MTGVGEKREVGGRGRERSNWSATAVLGIVAIQDTCCVDQLNSQPKADISRMA